MSAQAAESAPELRVAHPMGAQPATSGGAGATAGATPSATDALRAAARAVLARNKARNSKRNTAETGRNSEPSKPPPELRPVRAPDTPSAVRGRRLLERLRWTGRHVYLAPDGTLVVHPRLGTADLFGREVAAHPDDIAAVLAAETAGAVA